MSAIVCSDPYCPERKGREAAERLADDLAIVLAGTVVGWEKVIGHDLAQAPEVQRVMARYRTERGDAK